MKNHVTTRTIEEYITMVLDYQNEYDRLAAVQNTKDKNAQQYFRVQRSRFFEQGGRLAAELIQKQNEMVYNCRNFKYNDEICESDDVYFSMLNFYSNQKEEIGKMIESVGTYRQMFALLKFGDEGLVNLPGTQYGE